MLSDTRITVNGVTLANCEFLNTSLTLENAEDVLVSNNVFSGSTTISLSLLGASNNRIEHNEFKSAIYNSVHIYWDPISGRSSNNNEFFKNYFTHQETRVTNRAIRVNWATGYNESISGKNRFIKCAFKEKKRGQLNRVLDDDTTWWMVAKQNIR